MLAQQRQQQGKQQQEAGPAQVPHLYLVLVSQLVLKPWRLMKRAAAN
jgi:hypothetical protein